MSNKYSMNEANDADSSAESNQREPNAALTLATIMRSNIQGTYPEYCKKTLSNPDTTINTRRVRLQEILDEAIMITDAYRPYQGQTQSTPYLSKPYRTSNDKQ